jgi:hypothetical protein
MAWLAEAQAGDSPRLHSSMFDNAGLILDRLAVY